LGERTYFACIMASRRNGTLYIGAANNLALRACQHRTGVGSTFTTKCGVKMLVWCEQYGEINEAIAERSS
jgi:putative endonuclease